MEAKKLIGTSTESYIEIQGVQVYYERYEHPAPKGTLLFIHGFVSSTFSFRNLIPLFKKDYTVISIDLPGFGKSEKSKTFYYSYQNYGKLIIEAMDKLQERRVTIVGHSMGGQIALHVAKQFPELVDKLFLIASSGYLRKARWAARYISFLPYYSWFVKQWFKTQNVYKKFHDSLHDKSILSDEIIQAYLAPFSDRYFFNSLIRLLRHREGDLSSIELSKIKTPSVLIWGKEDKVVPLKIGYRLKQDLPNANVVEIANAGHMICDEKPKEIYMQMLQHL